MDEPIPPNLDDDGKTLWEMCDWILTCANNPLGLQLQALAIRRELRLESVNAALLEACETALAVLEADWEGDTPSITGDMLRAAIAKARGTA